MSDQILIPEGPTSNNLIGTSTPDTLNNVGAVLSFIREFTATVPHDEQLLLDGPAVTGLFFVLGSAIDALLVEGSRVVVTEEEKRKLETMLHVAKA
jgi:hypothetical protein